MFVSKAKLMMAVLVVALVVPATAFAAHSWPDVPDDKFYTESVAWAKANGMTTGCDGGTNFCPERGVTRGENITYAKRYDDIVAQPAFLTLGAAADAAQADADAAQADADAAQADADNNNDLIYDRPIGPVWVGFIDSNGDVYGNSNFCSPLVTCEIEASYDGTYDGVGAWLLTSPVFDFSNNTLDAEARFSIQATPCKDFSGIADYNVSVSFDDFTADQVVIAVTDNVTGASVQQEVCVAIWSLPYLVILSESDDESGADEESEEE